MEAGPADSGLEVDSEEWHARVRESWDNRPKPTVATVYLLEMPDFWNTRHLPVGSVMTYDEGGREYDGNVVAVRVEGVRFEAEGAWVKVKFLGCSEERRRKALQAYFRKGAKEVHLCVRDRDGLCPLGEIAGAHLDSFTWHPAGSFTASWLGKTADKYIFEGLRMEAKESEGGKKGPNEPRATGKDKKAKDPEPKERTAKKLEELRARLSSRPSAFAKKPGEPRSGGAEDNVRVRFGDGISGLPAEESLVERPSPPAEKNRVQPPEREEKKKKATVASSLAVAAAKRQEEDDRKKEKEKTKRSRSKSKGSKKSKKRKHQDDQQSSSTEEEEEGSDSSSSLVPPLKKKALRDPGSVFKMLETQAREQLAQDGVVDDPNCSTKATKACLYTFYQLVLKPEMDPRSRDSKEVSMLARTLDLLKEGRLPQVADLLAARLIAVTTAVKQGWGTARHLEVHQPEDESVAPPHVLLAAQRHARQVEKAGGKGSWSRGSNWSWEGWQGDPKPKGKGKDQKGKGKKGKKQGKGKGGGWNYWGNEPKEKTGDQPQKPDS